MAVDPFVELAEPEPGNTGDASHADAILQTEANWAKWAVALRQSVRQLFPVS
jgi:hypothetical protein